MTSEDREIQVKSLYNDRSLDALSDAGSRIADINYLYGVVTDNAEFWAADMAHILADLYMRGSRDAIDTIMDLQNG